MKFLVHIGVNKTGTSSLQRALYDNRDKISEQGILYPEMGVQTAAHHGISRVVRGATPASQGMPDDWEDKLRAEFGDHQLCILSSESFATLPDPSPLARICPPGDTRIVIYLRDYASYMVSWYQQAVHSRNISPSIDDFIENHQVSFEQIISRWAKIYGRENVTVRLYDRERLKDRDIVADFCDLAVPGVEKIFEELSHDFNPSLSGNLLFFKRLLNCFISREESLEIASEVIALSTLDPTFRGKLDIGAETIKRIRILTRDDAAIIKTETGFDLSPPRATIKGAACPDTDRLGADLEMMLEMMASRDFIMLKYVQRMAGITGLKLASGANLADLKAGILEAADTTSETTRDVAQALFALNDDSPDAETRKQQWNAQRPQYTAQARKLLRRLKAGGYTVAK